MYRPRKMGVYFARAGIKKTHLLGWSKNVATKHTQRSAVAIWSAQAFALFLSLSLDIFHILIVAVGKHFTDAELHSVHRRKTGGVSIVDIHQRLCSARERRKRPGPDLITIRRALKG